MPEFSDAEDSLRKASRIASPEAEEQLRLLVENLRDYAIFTLDTQGRVASWNAGAERIQGYPAHEVISKHFSVFYPQEELRSGRPFALLETVTKEGHFEEEGWRVRKDGSRFWASTVITALREPGGRLAGYGAVVRDFSERKRADEALRISEERFRLLVQGIRDYAIFMLDPEGRISSWNEGAEQIKGYKASEVIGKHFSIFYPEEDLRRGKPAWELEVATRTGHFEDHSWRLRKDGSRYWASVVITALKDDSGALYGFSKVTRDMSEKRKAQEALEGSERSLRELSGRLLRMQDEERGRLGRELHDTIGQYLSALKMSLEILGSTPAAKTADSLAECIRIADQCIREVRTISYLLYPPMLEEMGLQTAIEW